MDYFDQKKNFQRIFDNMSSAERAARAQVDVVREMVEPWRSPTTNYLALDAQLRAIGDAERLTRLSAYEAIRSFQDRMHRDSFALGAARLDDSALRAIRSANEDWFRGVAEVARQVRSSYDLARQFGADRFSKEAGRSDWLQRIQAQATGYPALNMFASELLSGAHAGALNPTLFEGLGAELFGQMAKAESLGSEEAVASFLQSFLEWLLEQVGKVPPKAIWEIFLMVASIVISSQLGLSEVDVQRIVREENQAAEERVLGQLEEVEERIMEQLQKTEGEIVQECIGATGSVRESKEHVLLKSANLRRGPKVESEPIQILPPNLLVEEVERVEGWVHVAFFDYVQGVEKKGWIASELLMEVRDSPRDAF